MLDGVLRQLHIPQDAVGDAVEALIAGLGQTGERTMVTRLRASHELYVHASPRVVPDNGTF